MAVYRLRIGSSELVRDNEFFKDAANPFEEERDGRSWHDAPFVNRTPQSLRFIEAGTGNTLPTRYCLGDFAHEDVLDRLIHSNNVFAYWHHIFTPAVQQQYDRFLTLGLRVAQQLDGEFHRRTMVTYEAARSSLDNMLFEAILDHREQRKRATANMVADSIPNVPKGDRARLERLAQRIEQEPDEYVTSTRAAYGSFDTGSLLRTQFLARPDKTEWEQDWYIGLRQYWERIPDTAKTSFLRLALQGIIEEPQEVKIGFGRTATVKRNWSLMCVPEFVGIVEGVSGTAAKAYFQYALACVQPPRNSDWPNDAIGHVRGSIDDLEPSQHSMFLTYLRGAQRDGFEFFPIDVAKLRTLAHTQAGRIKGRAEADNVRDAFIALKEKKGEDSGSFRNALSQLERELTRDQHS